jgi:hypothetical protein
MGPASGEFAWRRLELNWVKWTSAGLIRAINVAQRCWPEDHPRHTNRNAAALDAQQTPRNMLLIS